MININTKRILVEQIDDERQSPAYSNFDAFSDGFSRGFSIKGLGFTLLVLLIIFVILLIL